MSVELIDLVRQKPCWNAACAACGAAANAFDLDRPAIAIDNRFDAGCLCETPGVKMTKKDGAARFRTTGEATHDAARA